MLERDFQAKLIRELRERYPGCIVIKGDSRYQQGIPDILLLYGSHWAALEVKNCASAPHQPNQDWFVQQMNQMSFARFVYPDILEEVLHELDRSFQS